MGLRGYLLLKLRKHADEDSLWNLKNLYESIDGIEFADNVIGSYDFILILDLPYSNKKLTIESITEKVKNTDTCDELITLKTNNTFIKHLEIKDLKILNELT